MKQYITTAVVNLNDGLVELDADQARRRRNKIEHVEGNVYKILSRLQFKVGEKLGYNGIVNKMLLNDLSEAEDESYNTFSADELKIELDARDIKYRGNASKPALVSALEDDDDAQDSDNE